MQLAKRVLFLCFLSLVLVPISATLAQQPSSGDRTAKPRPITIDDYFQIRAVSDPQLSPDGRFATYTVQTQLPKEDKSETRIWMVPAAGGEAIPLTAAGVSSSHARFSPDGESIAFLSARDDGKTPAKTQVWLLPRHGGEAVRLTDTPQDVEDFAWSPDSRRLVLILRDASPEELEAAKGAGKEPEKKEKPKAQRPWVIDRLQFKMDEVGYLDRRRTHLYIFDLAAKKLTQITSGDFDDSEPAWSPDGKSIAFTSNRSRPDPDLTYNTDIWVVAADNMDKGVHLTQVTTNPGADAGPAWSPDGKWITYVTQLEPRIFDYATRHVAISPASGGEAKVLTLSFDRMTSTPRFSPDGKFVYFIADDDGTQNLCRISAAGGEVTRPVGGRLMVNDYALAPTAMSLPKSLPSTVLTSFSPSLAASSPKSPTPTTRS